MRILIADDDAVSRRLLKRTLDRLGHETIEVGDGPQAVSALMHPEGPRMAIIDWMMPGADGPTVCRAVRARSEVYVYIIMLTAREGRDDVIAGLDSGADDFLTKPFDAAELRSRLRCGTRVLALEEGLLKAHAELSVLATQDVLTGLWNRRRILEQVDAELVRAKREDRPMSIAMIDIDHFKKINDTHGHPIGDAVIREVAARLRSALRDYDAIGRFGGEEFMVLLPGCAEEAGMLAATRVLQSVSRSPIETAAGPLPVRVSIGVSFTDYNYCDAETLIQRADDALYRSKTAGRNRVSV
jgi:diguanylate cyclase (GGDEF)-like protein